LFDADPRFSPNDDATAAMTVLGMFTVTEEN
jgi:hypothetical protein